MSKASNAKRGADLQQRVVGPFIVLWDDNMGVCCPMGWDDDCAGAICCLDKSVAIFASRKAARKAIDISTKYALLCKAQGKPVNLDFLGECRKNLRVVACRPNAELSDSRPL
jgi:hypothetical protein